MINFRLNVNDEDCDDMFVNLPAVPSRDDLVRHGEDIYVVINAVYEASCNEIQLNVRRHVTTKVVWYFHGWGENT
jgi:uncharacterized protein YlxW (UPF0749 family)